MVLDGWMDGSVGKKSGARWMDGWMGRWVGGRESGFKDCLQQSKNIVYII